MASTADIFRKVFEVGSIGFETFGKIKQGKIDKADKAEAREKDLNKIDRQIDEDVQAREEKIVGGRIKARAKVAETETDFQNKVRLAEKKAEIKQQSEKLKSDTKQQTSKERFNLWLQGKIKPATDQERRHFENQLEGRTGAGKKTKERDFVKETKEGFDKQLKQRSQVIKTGKDAGKGAATSIEEAGLQPQTGTYIDFYNQFIAPQIESGRARDSTGALLGDPAAQDRFAVRQQAGTAQAIGDRQFAGPTASLGSEIEQVNADRQPGAPEVIDITPMVDPNALTLDQEQLLILLQKERDGLIEEEEFAELLRLIQMIRGGDNNPFPAVGQ